MLDLAEVERNFLRFACISGSHAYGTNIETSDEDRRGIFVLPCGWYGGLSEPVDQVNNAKQDIIYYSLKRFFNLAQAANPNILELLWMPEDTVILRHPSLEPLFRNRHIFITKRCITTHVGYAYAQIDKAKGQNKMVHNPQPEARPRHEDFCYLVIPTGDFPMRPVPVQNTGIDLKDYNASSVEHIGHLYRLYHYGPNAKGVFRGDNLVCESIPKEDERERFAGLLIYNKQDYEQKYRDWKRYWTWREERNECRWVDQEKGLLNFDQKNMTHCLRLLMSGENIVRHGEPIVRFEGERRDLLMRVRRGELSYEQIIGEAEERLGRLKEMEQNCTLPDECDGERADAVYREIANTNQD